MRNQHMFRTGRMLPLVFFSVVAFAIAVTMFVVGFSYGRHTDLSLLVAMSPILLACGFFIVAYLVMMVIGFISAVWLAVREDMPLMWGE